MRTPLKTIPADETWEEACIELFVPLAALSAFALGLWMVPFWMVACGFLLLWLCTLVCALAFRHGQAQYQNKTPARGKT